LIVGEFAVRESLAPGHAETFESQMVSFTLSPDAVRGLQADGRIALNVRRDDIRFRATITHPGRGFFESARRDEAPHVFSMAPRPSTVTSQSPADLGAQEGKYVGLSPFTQWILAFQIPARMH
jgi:hypothetical protein